MKLVEVELQDGSGCLQRDTDGTIRYIDNHGNTENVWHTDDPGYEVMREHFCDGKPLNFAALMTGLNILNGRFGKGTIKSITINTDESNERLGQWCGTVERRFSSGSDDTRRFKVENSTLTFLSHKRKLK